MTVVEIGPADTRLAFQALRALRPSLTDVHSFASRINDVQRPEGYRLVGVFAGGAKEAAAVAGFRVGNSLAWGRYLYVDDLSTIEEARRHGHARALLDWLLAEAVRQSCDQLHLDSGLGPERAAAHRLYLNSGLVIASHHFARVVPPGPQRRPERESA